jgi:GntR family transcriptional repressor for pyruvate dehydrogenase complex
MKVDEPPALLGMRRIERQTSLSEIVVGRLKELIAARELRPGDPLPSEVRLATRLGVARSTIREAKQVLSLLGALEVRAGKGTFVHADAVRRLAATRILNRSLDASRISLLEVYEGRAILESGIVGLAAERARAADIEAMQESLERMETAAAAADLDALVPADTTFHRSVVAAAQNGYLALAYGHTADITADAVACISQVPDNVTRALLRHRELLAAIQARHPEQARAALQQLLDDSRKTVEGALA